MTREEERQQAAIDYCNNLIREATFGQFVAHMAGSKWADEHPKADTRNDAVTGRKGVRYEQRTMQILPPLGRHKQKRD